MIPISCGVRRTEMLHTAGHNSRARASRNTDHYKLTGY